MAGRPQTGLVAAYGGNQGTAGGSNAGVTSLADQSGNSYVGTLTGFALSGSTSNWVESYALVVPPLAAATAVTTTGFTANWAAPASGTVSNYVLDYSASPTFATVAGSFSPASSATSQAVSGLQANRNYYYRLRADKTSGTVTGQGAYASGTVRMASGQTLPGNALAFDGTNDYVAVNALPAANNLAPTGGFTLETWVYVTTTTIHSLIRKDGDYNLYLNPGNLLACDVWPGGLGTAALTTTTTATALAANHWYHVAATWNGTATKLYLNGVDVTGTATARTGAASSPLQLGGSGTYGQYLTGRLDEMRLYSTALTPTQVLADMTSTSAAVPASLLLYYNFDQGTAGGSNAGYTTLTDQSATLADGTLTNFDLGSGNTTSNWVESYALLQPTGLAASAITGTGLTASWTAPTINGAAPAAGTVEGYVLDVATNATFSVAAPTTSQAVTGLANGTNYYLRVRANKASSTVGGQGAYSATFATHTVGTDAQLSSLTASAGTLSPAFASTTLAYTLPVVAGQSTFTLTPTASNSYTTITANGAAVASGAATTSYPAGTLVTLVLTSEDGQATRTYTVQSVNMPDYYRSVASGNWGDVSIWEGSDDNASWSPVPYAPSAGPQPVVSIRSGHVVTVAADVQLNRTTVLSGGTLTIAPGTTLEVFNAANPDLSVSGTLSVPAGAVLLVGRLNGANGYTGTAQLRGAILAVNSGATFTADGVVLLNSGSIATSLAAGTSTFNAGSRVVLYATINTLVVPTATWDPAATLELAGSASSVNVSGSFAGKTFGNVDVTFIGAGTHQLLTTTGAATVAGNFTVTRASGTAALRLISVGTTAMLTIGGSYVQNSGAVTGYVSTTTTGNGTTPGVSVGGSFTLLGGTFTAQTITSTTATTIRPTPLAITGSLSIGSGATFSVAGTSTAINYLSGVSLGGDFSNAGTFTTVNTSTPNTNQQLYFAKSGVQSFLNTGTISGRVNATVNAGSTLDLGTSAFTGTGTFTTLAGSTLRLGSPVGISTSSTATGNVQNTNTRTYGGSFEFNGAAAQATGTGFPAAVATAVAFNNPAGVALSQALAVTGTLSFKQGAVATTAANLLTLGSSGSSLGTLDATAANTGYVVGPLKRWVAAATGTTVFPVGTGVVARPASITFTDAPTAAGTLTAEFVPTDSGSNGLPLTEGSITINKAAEPGFWRVSAADGLAGGTYSPTFTYTSLTGTISRYYVGLVLLKRVDSSSPWTLQDTHVTTSGTRAAPVLSRTGLAGFSEFTAGGDGSGPLPVELVSFTATAQGSAAVRLAWATASEKNSNRFEVERSFDGMAFDRIGTLAAVGSSSAARAYELLDAHLPGGAALLYYRLKQVDADGTFSYSPVRSVALTGATAGLALYPNPAPAGHGHGGAATLTGARPGTVVTVYDALGRPVTFASADATGTATLVLPAGLPSGVYVVRAGTQALRLTVE